MLFGNLRSYRPAEQARLARRRRDRRRVTPRNFRVENLESRVLLYGAPTGGWTYEYSGDQAIDGGAFSALDGTWGHDNGSDSWDGSVIGAGKPGGVTGGLTDGDTTYVRLQDTGDPRSQGFGEPSNRKLNFIHNIGNDGAPTDVLDSGATISVRARIATDGLLDDANGAAWPAGGDGYVPHDGGKGSFSIHQQNGGTISFGLVLSAEDNTNFTGPGLAMNSLNGAAVSGDVDWQENEGTKNLYDVADPTAWQEFWITIQSGGTGTHQVAVYANESAVPVTFDVTSGNGNDGGSTSYLGLGLGSTGQRGAIDVDFIAFKEGIHVPGDVGEVTPAAISNTAASGITASTATIGGTVTDSGGQNPNVKVYWGNEDGGTDTAAWDASVDLGIRGGSFSTVLEGLNPSTTYFFRSLAENDGGSSWTPSTASFATTAAQLPLLLNNPATDVGGDFATVGVNMLNTGGDPPTVTMYWGDNNANTNAAGWDHSAEMGVLNAGPSSIQITGLSPNTLYYYRALAENAAGQRWALVSSSFTTSNVQAPTVAVSPASDIGPFSATLAGSIVNDGGSLPNTTIYWGDENGGTDAGAWDSQIDLGTQSGDFTSPVGGLDMGVTYFYRAFAENFVGSTWSSNSQSFTTPIVVPPTVVNNPATFITATVADVGGEVTDDGGQTPNVKIFFGDNDGGTDSDMWDQEILLGQQSGIFLTTLEDLTPSTNYFFRSQASNEVGQTWASSSEAFMTQEVLLPAIEVFPAENVEATRATLIGSVTETGNDAPTVTVFYGDNDGGTEPLSWDQEMTLVDRQDGSFSLDVVGLSVNTTHYFTARATNLAGDSWPVASQEFATPDVPTLVINELMADNNNTIATRTRENTGVAFGGPQLSPDWFEVRNFDTSVADLTGLYVTDEPGTLNKWAFPAGTDIAAGGYLPLFASGLNVLDTQLDQQGWLHTNFSLNADGGYLAITDGENVIHEYANYPNQLTDISYGIDENVVEFYFATPTPDAANNLGMLSVGDTSFSIDRGYYDAPFTTEITTSTEGATIIYTLDGVPPAVDGSNNILKGTTYDGPIDIATTSTLRAMAFKDGFISTNVDTHTYVFAADVLQQDGTGLPTFQNWGHAGPDWEVDPNVVNLPENDPNRVRESDLKAIPTVSLVMDWAEMFGSGGIYINGEGIPRATSFEYFDPLTGEDVQANASVQIQGGSSTGRWKSDKLSMRVKFREPYGPTKLNYPVFGDEASNTFDTIDLDAQLNYVWHYNRGSSQRSRSLYFPDQLTSDLLGEVSGSTGVKHGKAAHVYINGVYWGMHYMHERPDETFGSDYFGGDKDEYHAINQNRSINNAINPDGTPTGGNAAVNDLNAMVSTAQAAGSGGLAEWNTLKSELDVEHFVDYLLVNWYTGNGDWGDTKNWYATRANTPDGRWRFHSWDAEKALENFASGGRNDVGNGPKGLHSRLSGNEEYRLLFADRIQNAMFNGGALTPEGVLPIVQNRIDEIDRAIAAESARWGDNETGGGEPAEYKRSDWLSNVNILVNNFFPGRTQSVFNSLKNANLYPDTVAPTYEINGSAQHGGAISAGDNLAMVSAGSEVTTDTVLITQGDAVQAFVPTDGSLETGAGPLWFETDFVPGGWIDGTNGVGYEDSVADYAGLIETNVAASWNATESSLYTRFDFTVSPGQEPIEFDRLTLRMKYDDGFVAFLNGQEIARQMAPANAVWNTFATGSHSDSEAVNFVDFDITQHLSLLDIGDNVLAIHGLNQSNTSSDMLILPELVISEVENVNSVPVYYTVDGTDPRADGGAIVGTLYEGQIALDETTNVRARAFDGSQWSALTSTTFVVVPTDRSLVISEVNFHPHAATTAENDLLPNVDNDAFEFIEVTNVHPTQAINLLDVVLTDAVEVTLPNVSLAPGERGVVVRDLEAFQVRYGNEPTVLAEWAGGLSNNSERVTLTDALGNELMSVEYRDSDPWFERADGVGGTLELVDLVGTPDNQLSKAYRWQSSIDFGGSPGIAGSDPRGIVVNEVLARTDHSDTLSDAIELYNPTEDSIDLSGWFLSDSSADLLKYEIPAETELLPGEYVVFDETHFNPTPDTPGANDFALSGAGGDDVWLVVSNGSGQVSEFVDDVHFRASAEGESIGRVPDGSGRLAPLSRLTLGCGNSHARTGPLVISEVNYNPGEPTAAALSLDPAIVEDDLEFVEIYNPTTQNLSLTDWRVRGGVDHNFDDGLVLGADQVVVVISFNPEKPANADRTAAFRLHYGIDSGVKLVGGFDGQLSDSGEAVRLVRPGSPPADEPAVTPRLTEDAVLYDDLSPWATDADGSGESLQRLAPVFHGDMSRSWTANAATPGAVVDFGVTTGDLTGDGLVNGSDIDVLFDAINSQSLVAYYDLDGSLTVNTLDVEHLLGILGTSFGDANLDQVVDGTDYGIWNSHKFQSCNKTWSTADFNGDGVTDGSDYNLWNANKFQAAPAAAVTGRAPQSPAEVDAAVVLPATLLSSEPANDHLADDHDKRDVAFRVEFGSKHEDLDRLPIRGAQKIDFDLPRSRRVGAEELAALDQLFVDLDDGEKGSWNWR